MKLSVGREKKNIWSWGAGKMILKYMKINLDLEVFNDLINFQIIMLIKVKTKFSRIL
jgi:hypothetical protein